MEADQDGFSCPECGNAISKKRYQPKTPKQWFADMRAAVESSHEDKKVSHSN